MRLGGPTLPMIESRARLVALHGSHEADFDLLIEKRIGPIIGCRIPLAEAAAAQRHLIEEGLFGRVLWSL